MKLQTIILAVTTGFATSSIAHSLLDGHHFPTTASFSIITTASARTRLNAIPTLGLPPAEWHLSSYPSHVRTPSFKSSPYYSWPTAAAGGSAVGISAATAEATGKRSSLIAPQLKASDSLGPSKIPDPNSRWSRGSYHGQAKKRSNHDDDDILIRKNANEEWPHMKIRQLDIPQLDIPQLEIPQLETPQLEIPQLEIPQLPPIPSLPTLPEFPAMPTLPALPTLPDLPTLPAMPSLPGVAELPKVPQVSDIPEIYDGADYEGLQSGAGKVLSGVGHKMVGLGLAVVWVGILIGVL